MQDSEFRNDHGQDIGKPIYTKQEHIIDGHDNQGHEYGMYSKQILTDQRVMHDGYKQMMHQNLQLNARGFNQSYSSIGQDISSTQATINYNNLSKNDNTGEQYYKGQYDPYDQSPETGLSSLASPENMANNTTVNMADPQVSNFAHDLNQQGGMQQQQPLKNYNLQTHELQPEIQGMIIALRYLGLPNHKVIQEIDRLGFSVNDSNVQMVYEDWSSQRMVSGKGNQNDFKHIQKDQKNPQRKNYFDKRGGMNTTDDEDDEEFMGDPYDVQFDESNEFDENVNGFENRMTRQKSDKSSSLLKNGYYENYNRKVSNKRDYNAFNGNKAVEHDFDSDYDDDYKKKMKSNLPEGRKENYQGKSQQKTRMHGDHYLFYDQELGKCFYCAQKGKDNNEVYTLCMECDNQGQNKIYMCEECFEQMHGQTESDFKKQQQVKDEDQEQPFFDSDGDYNSDSSDGIQLKRVNQNKEVSQHQAKNQASKEQNDQNKFGSNKDNLNGGKSISQNILEEKKLQNSTELDNLLKQVEQQAVHNGDNQPCNNYNEGLMDRLNNSNGQNKMMQETEAARKLKKLKIFRNPQQAPTHQ